MKHVNISPEFLISDEDCNPIVKRDKIITIGLNDTGRHINALDNVIYFELEVSGTVFWNYSNKEALSKDWDKIKSQLNKTMIEF